MLFKIAKYFHDGVILRNEGSRAGTLPKHIARCFTLFSMTRGVWENNYIIT